MKKIALSILAISSLVVANEPNLAKDKLLVTHTEFGYINTQGNTQTTSFSLESHIQKGWQKHIAKFKFDGQYASDKGNETKNKYLVELTYNYEFSDKFAFNYLLGFKQDKFSGYNYQAYTGPGANYKLIKDEKHLLSLEGNILYAQDDIEEIKRDKTGTIIAYPNPDNKATVFITPSKTNTYGSARAKMLYKWQILKNLKFNQELTYRTDIEDTKNYFIFSKTALTSKISDIFSAGISYKIDYINIPATGKTYSDKTFTANLIIDY